MCPEVSFPTVSHPIKTPRRTTLRGEFDFHPCTKLENPGW
jgi:hypothetical protein